MRGQPTTVVAVRPTAFHVHIWTGNASVRPPRSICVGPLEALLPIYLSAWTVSDSGWSFGSARWRCPNFPYLANFWWATLLAERPQACTLQSENHECSWIFRNSAASWEIWGSSVQCHRRKFKVCLKNNSEATNVDCCINHTYHCMKLGFKSI
jgi:hypothetical protein